MCDKKGDKFNGCGHWENFSIERRSEAKNCSQDCNNLGDSSKRWTQICSGCRKLQMRAEALERAKKANKDR